MIDRVHQLLNDEVRRDILETVIANKENPFVAERKAAQTLADHIEDETFKETIEALTRVGRLAAKMDKEQKGEVDPALFEDEAEQQLHQAVETVAKEFATADLEEKFMALQTLREPISQYFEKIMVMAEDEIGRAHV